MNDTQKHLQEAAKAHRKVLATQEKMIKLSQQRDQTIVTAITEGATATTVAKALGITPSRISHILSRRTP